jgi:predicted transcriptional regulator
MQMNEKKPTLLSIKQRTGITTEQLASEAGVTLGQAYTVEIGGFVDREIAERVIKAFTKLTGLQYTLDDIQLQNVSPRLPGRRASNSKGRIQD